MFRVRVLTSALAVLTVGLVSLVPVNANAAPWGCSYTLYAPHCYALFRMGPLDYSGYGIKGASVALRADCLDVPDPTNNFVDQTIWVTNIGGSTGPFLEVGMAYGNPQGSSKYFYWTHNGIEEDFASQPTLGVEYTAAITYTAGGTWHLQINGIDAYQTGWSPSAYYTQAGTESTNDNPHVFGAVKTMGFFNSAGSYHSGWDYPGHVAVGEHRPTTPYPYGYLNWVNTYTAGQDGDASSC